jgi:hypothetical protein
VYATASDSRFIQYGSGLIHSRKQRTESYNMKDCYNAIFRVPVADNYECYDLFRREKRGEVVKKDLFTRFSLQAKHLGPRVLNLWSKLFA